jgi:hypothetical protein
VTREELTAIAGSVIVNWGLELNSERRKDFYRTWWRYLGDLDAVAVRTAVDATILADKPFAPRAGTIRRMVFAEQLADVITADAAWAQAVDRIRAVQQGTWTDLAPLVARALAESGVHGTSRDDHEAFVRAWRRVVEELELERLALPPTVDAE